MGGEKSPHRGRALGVERLVYNGLPRGNAALRRNVETGRCKLAVKAVSRSLVKPSVVKLKWTRFTRAEFVERMYLLVGVALRLWTSVERAVEGEEPKVRPESRTKGARLSLARIGSYYWQKMSKHLRLTARFVRSHLPPPPCLRMFKWLMAPHK